MAINVLELSSQIADEGQSSPLLNYSLVFLSNPIQKSYLNIACVKVNILKHVYLTRGRWEGWAAIVCSPGASRHWSRSITLLDPSWCGRCRVRVRVLTPSIPGIRGISRSPPAPLIPEHLLPLCFQTLPKQGHPVEMPSVSAFAKQYILFVKAFAAG